MAPVPTMYRGAVRVSDFPDDSLLTLRPGVSLAYRGDRVPYADCKNLISKGKKLGGLYLLPAFNGTTWTDTPGSTTDEYVVLGIETGRRGTRGNDLPDMVWIKGSGYASVKFGLRPNDVLAKFVLLMSPAERSAITAGSHGELLDVSHAWEDELRADGW